MDLPSLFGASEGIREGKIPTEVIFRFCFSTLGLGFSVEDKKHGLSSLMHFNKLFLQDSSSSFSFGF